MVKHTRYENKKVLVLGLALSGFHAAKLLHELGAMVTVNDSKELADNPDAQELIASGIRVISGYHPVDLLDESFAYIIKNPGIPYSNEMVQRALALNIPIFTEVELAYEIMAASLIAITGSNGKTTTTTMVHEILKRNRKKGVAHKAGNIGIPAATIAKEASAEDDVIMELSSFQLMGIDTYHPEIAVITNIGSSHLDYHGTREAYVKAKWRITMNQTAEDYLVLNWGQEELRELSKTAAAQIVPFSRIEVVEQGAYVLEEWLYFKGEKIMPVDAIGVPGSHNVENALAAIAVAKLKGADNESITEALRAFGGVKHRIQYVTEVAGRVFYNDSKSTNITAAQTALNSFPDKSIVYLAGGLDRGNSFDELIPAMKNVHTIIVFGETKERLSDVAEKAGIPTIIETETITTAVPLALANSQEGDVILLSPACASWDQYKNFEIRGDAFIDAVYALKHEQEEG